MVSRRYIALHQQTKVFNYVVSRISLKYSITRKVPVETHCNHYRDDHGSGGATENAGVENAIRAKLQGWKMQEWKKQE